MHGPFLGLALHHIEFRKMAKNEKHGSKSSRIDCLFLIVDAVLLVPAFVSLQ